LSIHFGSEASLMATPLLLALETASFRQRSSAWIAFVWREGRPIFGCSLTQIWSNGQGKFRQQKTEWWTRSSQNPFHCVPS